MIYDNVVDPYLSQYAFNRSYIDHEILIGGKVVYSKGINSITFKHNPMWAKFSCRINEGNIMEFLSDIVRRTNPNYRSKNNSYKNKEEYLSYINDCLELLREYYLE